MSVIYNTPLKTARMQFVNDVVSSKSFVASSGPALAGKLVIGTNGLSGTTGVLATFTLPATPFNVTAGPPTKLDLITGGGLSVTASASGTAALAEFRNFSDGVVISGLTVGVAGTDIILSSTAITAGNAVIVTAGTITHG